MRLNRPPHLWVPGLTIALSASSAAETSFSNHFDHLIQARPAPCSKLRRRHPHRANPRLQQQTIPLLVNQFRILVLSAIYLENDRLRPWRAKQEIASAFTLDLCVYSGSKSKHFERRLRD